MFIRNKLLLFLCSTIILINGCDFKPQNAQQAFRSAKSEVVWVFASFNLTSNGEDNLYHYFGAVQKSLYERITANELSAGFVTLQDVRYWNTEDLIQPFEDDQDSGTLTFRIEHLIKMDLEKGDPALTYPVEQVSPEGLEYRRIHEQKKSAAEAESL